MAFLATIPAGEWVRIVRDRVHHVRLVSVVAKVVKSVVSKVAVVMADFHTFGVRPNKSGHNQGVDADSSGNAVSADAELHAVGTGVDSAHFASSGHSPNAVLYHAGHRSGSAHVGNLIESFVAYDGQPAFGGSVIHVKPLVKVWPKPRAVSAVAGPFSFHCTRTSVRSQLLSVSI